MDTAKVIARFLAERRVLGLADKTMEQYEWALKLLITHCRELPRTGEELLPVVSHPVHGLESRKDIRKCLNTFFRWCGRRYQWPNPVKELEPLPKRKRLPWVFTELEVERLLAASTNQRDRALLLLVLDTGLRIGEIARLTWCDVGPDYLQVRDGKTGDRLVPISPEVKRLMLGLGDGVHIWMGKKGPLSRSGVMQAYRRMFRRSGLTGPKRGPHALRHTFGTTYIANGGNLFSLQCILGHSNVTTTQIYVNLAQSQVKADHARYSPVRTLGLLGKIAGEG
jgi:site-specific recombinase XerD